MWCKDCPYWKGVCTNPGQVRVSMKAGEIEWCDGKPEVPSTTFVEQKSVGEFFEWARSCIDSRIKEELEKMPEEERAKYEYVLEGGKRLRPSLMLLSFLACEGKKWDRALEAALSLEKQHTASLVLDDLMDKDEMRRGKPAFYKAFGISDAILLPIELIYTGLRMVSPPHPAEIPKTIFTVGSLAVKGQMKDLKLQELLKDLDKMVPVLGSAYFEAIQQKTASLFAGSCKAGAIEAGAPEETQNLFWDYGMEIGMAYQFADDLVDLEKGKLEPRKLLVAVGGQLDKFVRGRESFTPMDLFGNAKNFLTMELKERMKKAERIARTMDLAETVYRRFLLEAPRFIIESMLKEADLKLGA